MNLAGIFSTEGSCKANVLVSSKEEYRNKSCQESHMIVDINEWLNYSIQERACYDAFMSFKGFIFSLIFTVVFTISSTKFHIT